MAKFFGIMVVGPGEADRYLALSLSNLRSLTDDGLIVLNNVDEKTRQMVERSGFRSYSDDREWGLHQPLIKEELVRRAYSHRHDWIVAIDADEVLEVTREQLEGLADIGETSWYFYVTQLWDDEEHWKPELSFWNVRMFASRPDLGHDFEHRPLHCGLAPKWAYHYAWYAPYLLTHRGLMDQKNRLRKAERYKMYDPVGRWKPLNWYRWLESKQAGEGLDRQKIIDQVTQEFVLKRERRPEVHMANNRTFVFLQRDDGSVIDVPEKSVAETLRRNPLWKQVATSEGEPEQGVAVEPPPLISDVYECDICGKEAASELGLKIHKGQKHKA